MESIAHSRQPNKVSAAFSKKTSNGNHGSLPAKGLYDDVYGGPPKFGVNSLSPRFEDYGEIFGSFHTTRTSSIPVLDLPLVDENEVFLDVRSSVFDYGEVFGGFNGLDFAVSYEDLFHQPNVRDGVSSEEAWTPAETDSISGESDHSGNDQSISKGDSYQPVDGDTEFNISYHKVNGISNADINAENREGNLGKPISHPPDRTSGKQTFGDDLNLHSGYSRSGSHSRETFITVSDINLRTYPSQVPPPSRPPPILDVKKGDTGDFYLNTQQVAPEGTLGDSSPPFFDVEVDMNSSAAASAVATEEAVHRVEAKLRGPKELREGKKDSFESHVKSSYHVKNNEGKISGNITRSSSLKDERIQGASDRRYSKIKIPVTDERQKAMKVVVETPVSLERERPLHTVEKSAEEKRINESISSQGSDRSTGAGTWKEETEFFELVGTEESPNVFQSVNHSKRLAEDARICEHDWKANLQDESKLVKAIEENCQLDEYKKKSKAAKEAYELDKIIRRSKASREDYKQREHMKKEKVAKFSEEEENENIRIARQHGKTEKKLTDADQSGNLENMFWTQQKEVKKLEGEKLKEVDRLYEVHQVMRLKENEKKLKEADKQSENVKKHKQTDKVKEKDERERKAFALGQEEGEEKQTKSMEMKENDGRLKEAVGEDINGEESCQRENERNLKQTERVRQKGLKEAHEREEIEKILEDAFGKEGDEGPKQALEEKNGKRQKEALDLDVNEIRLEETIEQGRNDKRVKEAYERIHDKRTSKEACGEYAVESGLQEADDIKDVQNALNQGVGLDKNSGILKEAQRKEETESSSNQGFKREGSGAISNEDSHQEHSEVLRSVGGEERDKELDKGLERMEGNEDGKMLKLAKDVDKMLKKDCDPNHLAAHSTSNHEESGEKQEESRQSPADQVIGRAKSEYKVGEKKLEEVTMENLMANKNSGAPEMTPGDSEQLGTQSVKLDDCGTEDDEPDSGSQEIGIEKLKTVPQLYIDPRNLDRKFAHEWDERGKNNQHVKIALSQEESMDQGLSNYANLHDHNGRNTEAAKPATVLEAVNENITQFHVGQSTESKEKNFNEIPASEEKDAERMRREREVEKDRLRKIDEERQREREREKDRMAVDKAMLEAEREREREKDRMAVDRATLQAHDRAFAEARDRAERAAFERATAEARQRALTEARERLEKACAEARDKSFADKASTEARLKAERAAVERATAEARERAMEKAKAERAAFESRERLERSVSENFTSSFRSGGRQGISSSEMQDSQYQNFGSSAGSRHPYSSVHACSFSERSEGEGESAQRCRARLERYRRTAERAAKALEEKNMRDQLAQKEQAERNRLAETLDAEVRRWSSGKEGNLRALLSTLQYILGPDSGWQPIPLTEVITSAAVKKAYRKATLCVHPDKLQQRGASIQHKYICEKVFDLLKEAWNKFNSEER